MKLVKCSMDEFKKLGGGLNYASTKNLEILYEFLNSDMQVARVENYTQKTAYSCQNSLTTSIKRFNKGGIKCVVRAGKVFLVKTT